MELKVELRPARAKQVSSPPPPPPPPPLSRFWVAGKPAAKAMMTTQSVTNLEIAKFWQQKQMEEEDHLLAALKAAARVKAQKLSKCKKTKELMICYNHGHEFVDSTGLHDPTENEYEEWAKGVENEEDKAMTNHDKETDVGIKDWWRNSKYAYLNQPPIGSIDTPKRRSSSYVPNFCSYKLAALHPFSLSVF